MQITNKSIIGLGCSWTQGEGGYPRHIWKQYKGRVNLPMHKSYHLIPYEHENSWVNVLSRDHFTEFASVNLGQRGIGNRGAAKSLYLTNLCWNDIKHGIVVFMLSGFERFDFFRQDWNSTINAGEHPNKPVGHYNFQTVWPHLDNSKLWKIYAREVYSDAGAAAEVLSSILEVQNFCRANNFDLIIANAFDSRGKDFIFEHCGKLANQIDWDSYIHDSRNYKSFAELLVEQDNWLPDHKKADYFSQYQNLAQPLTYLTNCVHPTIEGHKLIAKELAEFIQERYSKS